MTIPRRFARAALAGALALLPACALNGSRAGVPSDPDRITLDEIAASGETNAYEVVQRLRPAWLRLRVDPRSTGVSLQTLVIHNGARYGYLSSLRDLPAEMIGSMRFMVGSEAQSLLTGTDQEIGAIIQVSSRGVTAYDERRENDVRDARRVNGRNAFTSVAVSVYPLGHAPRQRSAEGSDLMLRSGWTMTRSTPATSRSMMAAAEVTVVPSVTVGLVAARQSGTEEEAYTRGEGAGGVAFTHTSDLSAAVLGYRLGPLRVGAGPVLQVSTVTFAAGECGCLARESRTRHLRGKVVDGTLQLRVLRILTGELRVQRYFLPEASVPTYTHTSEYDVSRPDWFVGLGLGLRVGR